MSNNSQPSFQSRDLSSLYASITPNPGVQVSDGKNKKTFNAADSSQTIERSTFEKCKYHLKLKVLNQWWEAVWWRMQRVDHLLKNLQVK